MKGIWKENLSGYDRKGNKRKKQSWNHYMKDNFKSAYTRNYKRKVDELRREGEVVFDYKEKRDTKQFIIKNCIVSVDKQYVYKVGNIPLPYNDDIIREAYEWHGTWYDSYDGTPLDSSWVIKILKVLFEEYVTWDEDKEDVFYKNHWVRVDDSKGKLFFHDREVPQKYFKMYGLYSTKGRKYAQKKANSMDRQRVRNYIASGNWDEVVKTHSLSKSIAWEIW